MNRKARKLNRENKEQDRYLNGKYEQVMTDMICYLRGADITEYQVELIRKDLLEKFIDAKNKNKDIEEIVGEDYKAFCDQILESVPKRTKKEKCISLLSTIFLCAGILTLIKTVTSESMIYLIRRLIRKQKLNFNMAISWGDIIAMVLLIAIAIWFVNWISKNAFQTGDGKTANRENTVLLFVGFFAIFAIIMLIQYCFRGFILFFIPIYIVVIIAILLLLVSKLIDEL